MRALIISLLLLGLFSCKPTQPTNAGKSPIAYQLKTYYVAPYRVNCTGEGLQKCFLLKRKISDQWQYFFSNIEGFKFEAGYSYIIKVKESEIENPPADASNIKYELDQIVHREQITQPLISLYDIWGVLSIDDINLKEEGVSQMFEINTNKKQLLGQGCCNNFSAQIITKEGENLFSTSDFKNTEVYCEQIELEEKYFSALQEVDRFYRFNNRLLLLSGTKVRIEAIKMD